MTVYKWCEWLQWRVLFFCYISLRVYVPIFCTKYLAALKAETCFLSLQSDVLNLPIFKDEQSTVFQNMDTADLDSSSVSE